MSLQISRRYESIETLLQDYICCWIPAFSEGINSKFRLQTKVMKSTSLEILMAKPLFLILFCLSIVQGGAQNNNRVDFNGGWKFKLDSSQTYSEPDVNDADWRLLNLPHDWSIEGSFNKDNPATPDGGALPGGLGWYRKTFTLPLADK